MVYLEYNKRHRTTYVEGYHTWKTSDYIGIYDHPWHKCDYGKWWWSGS